MDADTQARLKGTFDEAASAYAAARPDYPDVAVAWLLPGDPSDVLDLGAGTGALTRALASRGHRVVAAEPSRNLLAELAAAGPSAAVQATAEQLPFATSSFDVVTVATAFHWFDHARAVPEIARVLRPGGRLALVWNTRVVGAPWTSRLNHLLRSAQPPTLRGHWGTSSVHALDGSPHFAAAEYAVFPHVQRIDSAGLVSLVASRSYVIALDEARRDRLFAQVTDLADDNADPDGYVELPYRCQCWRAAVQEA